MQAILFLYSRLFAERDANSATKGSVSTSSIEASIRDLGWIENI